MYGDDKDRYHEQCLAFEIMVTPTVVVDDVLFFKIYEYDEDRFVCCRSNKFQTV
jgi:hypothetical protein